MLDPPLEADPISDHCRDETGHQRLVLDATDGQHLEREHRPGDGGANTAPKPAAMPAMSRRRTSPNSRRKALPKPEAKLPPSWTAVPSRPAEPPNRCVATVETRISGAMRKGTPAPGSWICSTIRLLPPSAERPNQW